MSVVAAPLELCHTVPPTPGLSNAYGGYRVTCAPDGQSGTLSFCPTNSCAGPCVVQPFSGFTCQPADPRFGASSVSVDCFGQNERVPEVTAL